METAIVEFCGDREVTILELAQGIDRSLDYTQRLVRAMKAAGYNLKVVDVGIARRVNWKETQPRGPLSGIPHERSANYPFTCNGCGLPGIGYAPNTKRCEDCYALNGLIGKPREYPARWRAVFNRHIGTGGCLVCGSPRAATRDGRWCHWTHDLTMLDPHEADALLEEYAPPQRDVWGRLIGV